MPRWPGRPNRLVAWVCVLPALAVVPACGGGAGPGTSGAESASGGISLSATVSGLPDGGLAVDYEVTNEGERPMVVADGVPVRDGPNLPEVEAEGAYVHLRDASTVEIARRTLGSPSRADDADPALMLGTLLAPGESRSGSVRLPAPVTLRTPYDVGGTELPELVDTVVFCIGLVDPADVEVHLQGQALPDQRVLVHPTRQLVLCSAEEELPA